MADTGWGILLCKANRVQTHFIQAANLQSYVFFVGKHEAWSPRPSVYLFTDFSRTRQNIQR
jgi:hypothetical protein